ncbi:MAG: hypothetical protein LBV08_07050 [Clostridiales bacterium]|nr:hypothetical protein [Clostridiales bacterium]
MKKIESSAKLNYQEAIKEVKNHFKNPLSDKNPVMLLKIFDVMLIEDENNGRHLHILDEFGTKLVLMDKGYIKIESAQLVKKFDKKLFIGNVLLGMFVNDIESGILSVKPLSLISHRGIVRLIY